MMNRMDDHEPPPPPHVTWIDLVIFAIPALILLPTLLVVLMRYPTVARVLGAFAGATFIWEFIWRINRPSAKRPPDPP